MLTSTPSLVLASSSPRRKELLELLGIAPTRILATNIDETPHPKETPDQVAKRLAQEKLEAACTMCTESYILAADTVVCTGRTMIPKAETDEDERAALERLSGRRHRVHTGVAVMSPDGTQRVRLVTTTVQFKRLTSLDIEWYVQSGQGLGKSGAYGIQTKAGAFIKQINGCHFNVMGLPLYDTMSLLLGLGFPHPIKLSTK